MKINLDLPTEEARIEIIPLIDVIFCILTFFLLAGLQLTRQQAIRVDLPQASSGVPQMREMLILTLDDFGQLYVEQQKIGSREQLAQSLRNYQSTNPNGLMVLYASRTASYNDVVQVLDFLRTIGGDRVALATLPGASGQAPPSPTPVVPAPTPALPGATPGNGTNPIAPNNPNGTINPPNQLNPNQPSLPINPGQFPNGQGVTPNGQGNPTPLPTIPTIPTPGAPISPRSPAPAPVN